MKLNEFFIKEVGEPKDPSRRRFMKTAGSMAASAAMPGGTIGKLLSSIKGIDSQKINTFMPLLSAAIKFGNKYHKELNSWGEPDEQVKIINSEKIDNEDLNRIKDLFITGKAKSIWTGLPGALEHDANMSFNISPRGVPFIKYDDPYNFKTFVVFEIKPNKFFQLEFEESMLTDKTVTDLYLQSADDDIPDTSVVDPDDDNTISQFIDEFKFNLKPEKELDKTKLGRTIHPDEPQPDISAPVKKGVKTVAKSQASGMIPGAGATFKKVLDKVIDFLDSTKQPEQPQVQPKAVEKPLALPAPKLDLNDILLQMQNKMGRELTPQEIEQVEQTIKQRNVDESNNRSKTKVLKEFFGVPLYDEQKTTPTKELSEKIDKEKIADEVYWYILDNDMLHKKYFIPLAREIKQKQKTKTFNEGEYTKKWMPMVKEGCVMYYKEKKLQGHPKDIFDKEIRAGLCKRLADQHHKDISKDEYKLG